jgi:hypothetical protein
MIVERIALVKIKEIEPVRHTLPHIAPAKP